MKNFKTGAVVFGAAALFAIGGTTGAVAGDLIHGSDIAKDTITSRNLASDSVGQSELKAGVLDGIKGEKGDTGPAGPAGQAGPAGPAGKDGAAGTNGKDGVDGKDGVANPSAAGAGYDTVWPADGQVHETVETCAPGEFITGGGYSTFGSAGIDPTKDLGGDNADIQITVSAPYVASDSAYSPISDTDSRFYADRWVVRGYNNGTTPQVVRAWALCAPRAN